MYSIHYTFIESISKVFLLPPIDLNYGARSNNNALVSQSINHLDNAFLLFMNEWSFFLSFYNNMALSLNFFHHCNNYKKNFRRL